MAIRKGERKYFTREERERFIKAVMEKGIMREKVMFNFFLATGKRLSELHGLTVGKVQEGLKYGSLTITGKGDRTRTIPLLNGIKEDLQGFLLWKAEAGESLHPNAPLFCNIKGKRLSNRAIQQFVKNYCRKAGIRELSPHSFRHTVGFTMGNRGEPIQVIQKLLGHSNLNTTRIYVEPDLDQITACMSRALGSV